MKKLLLISALFVAIVAQAKAQHAPASISGENIIGGNVGMDSGAFNVGVTYDSGTRTGDVGGSFFLQTEKKKNGVAIVNQVMSFGPHININVYENNSWIVDLRPGVNITILHDVGPTNDDRTVFGPSFRWGVAYRLKSGWEIGAERLELWNWFDDEAANTVAYTTLVFRKRF